ncbi:hypothetical protein [Spirosoma spitsbergense]|uniref:hypothetical protein n=1 Tax=Spirosoma spitsbergense TaxID=431554 RepID=UPI0003645C14|nr:hypothetical protein [Spirosoma spitsbergense]
MAQEKQTLATFMASFFGKSGKAVSEKLTTDEHNQFTSEVQELQNKVTGLETQVTSLEAEKGTLQSKADGLDTKVTALESDKTTLQSSLTTAEADRDKYKGWFEKQAGAGAQMPEGDATSKVDNNLTSYNQQALAVFRKSKGLA